MSTPAERGERVNVNAITAPPWISSEIAELERLRKMPEGRERSEAFFALYHSYRKRQGWTYDAAAADRYESRRGASGAVGAEGLFEGF